MKKLIVIKGDQNAGKTTACRFILEVLLYKGAILQSYVNVGSKRSQPHFSGDFVATLLYKGNTIAICSRGDKLVWVKDNIKQNMTCDVVIVTSRHYSTFGKVIGVYNPIVFNKTKSGYQHLARFVKSIVKILP